MEAEWIMDQAHLWQLHLEHPGWGARRLKHFTHRSLTWVKKWLRRFRGADPDDETVLRSPITYLVRLALSGRFCANTAVLSAERVESLKRRNDRYR